MLLDREHPAYMAGLPQAVVADLLMVPRVVEAARAGKGIPYGDYPPEIFDSMDRMTGPEVKWELTQRWLPAVPGLVDRLQAGGSAADLGSGSGLLSIALARAYPSAHAFGYEPYEPSVKVARDHAAAAGLSARVTFETFDGLHVPGGPYDLITMKDALHHAGDPVAVLASARAALKPGGVFLIIDGRKAERLEEDLGEVRRILYPIGLLECLPTALAEGGPGYGVGIPEAEVRRLAKAAGYQGFQRVLPDEGFRAFFALTP